MTNPAEIYTPDSPFHRGEQEIQSRLGVREKMERFGKQVIRGYLPDQHKAFYNQLPFVLAGHADNAGWPWASLLFNEPGFISSKNDQQLEINASPIAGDPLGELLKKPLSDNNHLGLLGIELPTRRRNRLSGRITDISDQRFQLEVDQTFGNCPQYIQTRDLEMIDPDKQPDISIEDITAFDQQITSLIKNSDTFFVASYAANGTEHVSEGVDVSHRGGKPGFVRVDDDKTLTIPDYLGNFHFNTLGNFQENSKAGLLFIDFEHGHVLTLTGTVEILWDSPDTEYFEGAERLWQFRIDHGRWIKHGLPLRWKLDEYSPNTYLTGSWEEADKIKQAEADKNRWLAYEVIKVVDESDVIRSFHLKPKNGQRSKFAAGQFLTVKANIDGKELIRTYTVSSAPGDENYRISVKRETSPKGIFSNYLHEQISVGDVIEAKAPTGAFTFDSSVKRPALLISAGVGITPMIAMARHALIEGVRTRSTRPVTLISSARNQSQRAFFNELNEIAENSGGYIRNYSALSEIDEHLEPGKDFHHKGRISKDLLQAILPQDDYDVYLCGPSGFMQSMYDMLRELGINDCRIFAEAFGPASLKRDEDISTEKFEQIPTANEAIIEFSESKVEQAWSEADGTLLEFAEAHGLTPAYGCRSGQCGSCKAKLTSGKVSYQQPIESEIESDEVLICCAVPAAIDGEELAKITLAM